MNRNIFCERGGAEDEDTGCVEPVMGGGVRVGTGDKGGKASDDMPLQSR